MAEELFKSISPLAPPNIPRKVSSINWRLAFNCFSSWISVVIMTSDFPLTCCTEISPGNLLWSAERICCTGGSWAKRSDIWAPPLKSIPYCMPFTAILIHPAAVNTSDKPMNGHFLPRKSKLVFLNNSIEPVTAGLEYQTPACIQKFPPLHILPIRAPAKQTSGFRKTIQATTPGPASQATR